MNTNINSEDIRAARREYYRNWRKTHPEQYQATQMRYWQRKAEQMRKDGRIANTNSLESDN